MKIIPNKEIPDDKSYLSFIDEFYNCDESYDLIYTACITNDSDMYFKFVIKNENVEFKGEEKVFTVVINIYDGFFYCLEAVNEDEVITIVEQRKFGFFFKIT